MTISDLSIDRVYQETCSGIRTTDDISFKLLGLVPLLSGASILTLFLKDDISAAKGELLYAFAMFAALVTLGLFRWELRNIQTCDWLSQRARALEAALDRPALPRKPGKPHSIGKTEAEKWIYTVTICAWLAVPTLLHAPSERAFLPYTALCIAVLVAILVSLVPQKKEGESSGARDA